MVRTQIQLPSEMHKRLRRLAAERGVSVSALLRENLRRMLDEEPGRNEGETRMRSLRFLGSFSTGKSDLSERHDDYLDEAFDS
jgi:plasmid stability protein